jgi:hypothetical protein
MDMIGEESVIQRGKQSNTISTPKDYYSNMKLMDMLSPFENLKFTGNFMNLV